jgi:uncharacterized protein (DUF849 family)
MPLAMRKKVFITAALTGSGGTQDRSDKVPRSPEQIANDAIEAAKAGAAVVHCHVRDPETGAPARDVDLYREVVERIRASSTDVVVNLTAGMGGDIVLGRPMHLYPCRMQVLTWCRRLSVLRTLKSAAPKLPRWIAEP